MKGARSLRNACRALCAERGLIGDRLGKRNELIAGRPAASRRMADVHAVRGLAALILFLALAAAVLALLAVTWSPGFVMRVMAPRFGRWLCAVAGIHLVVEGQEHLARPAVIVANHRSALEVAII